MRRRTGSRKIAMRAARSQIPQTMLCRKPAIWQKRQPTGCRKQNPNRSGKPERNLFHNTSSPDSPSSLLRHRKNIRLRLRDRAIRHKLNSLFRNRLLQSGRSRFLLQTPNSPKREHIRQMRKQQRPRLSIHLRGFMKTQRLFLRKRYRRQRSILCVSRFLRLRRNRFLLQMFRSPRCGNMRWMLTYLCICPNNQIRGFMKDRRQFINRRSIDLCASWEHR